MKNPFSENGVIIPENIMKKEADIESVAIAVARMAEDELNGFRKIDMEFKPITFRPRQAGKNSINLIKIVRIGLKAMSDLRDINRSMR